MAELGCLASAVGKEICAAGWMCQSASSPQPRGLPSRAKAGAAEPHHTNSIKEKKRVLWNNRC